MLTIRDVIGILKKRVILIAVITIISTTTAAYISINVIKPQYKSSTKLFVGKTVDVLENGNYVNADVQLYQNLLKTYSEIITTEDLVKRALTEAKINANPNDVLARLSVVPQEKSQMIDISLTSFSAKEAKDILDAINVELMKTTEGLIPNSKVQVMNEPKVPEGPFSPNIKMNILIAFAMSMMLGVTLSLFLEYLDNTIKNKEDIQAVLGVPVLGVVHEYNEKRYKRQAKKGRRAKKWSISKKKHEVSMQKPLEQ